MKRTLIFFFFIAIIAAGKAGPSVTKEVVRSVLGLPGTRLTITGEGHTNLFFLYETKDFKSLYEGLAVESGRTILSDGFCGGDLACWEWYYAKGELSNKFSAVYDELLPYLDEDHCIFANSRFAIMAMELASISNPKALILISPLINTEDLQELSHLPAYPVSLPETTIISSTARIDERVNQENLLSLNLGSYIFDGEGHIVYTPPEMVSEVSDICFN